MKQYTVEITNEALADTEQLYNHIAHVLLAPENASLSKTELQEQLLMHCYSLKKEEIIGNNVLKNKYMR